MGVLKSILDTIKKLSEALFNYLGNADTSNTNVTIDEKNIKKIDDKTFDMPCKLKGTHAELPYTVKVRLKEDNLADIEVIYSEGEEKTVKKRSNVTNENFISVSERLVKSMLDADTKKSFGISSSKTMQVTLQKITAAKETSINLTAIKADYNLGEAYANLDSILEAPEFTDTLTSEPISFEIMDCGDDFDISIIPQVEGTVEYSLKQLLCATIQFYMDIQLLHWECARVGKLFYTVGSQLYACQDWIDRLGIWIIEATNSVYNILGDCRPDVGDNIDLLCDHSPCIETSGIEIIFPVFDRMIDTLEYNLPNLPPDMVQPLATWLRDLKHIRDFELKQD